jgi:lipopolysaccharide/colanic/teichoic acid biosynthesis glycosyltransferase
MDHDRGTWKSQEMMYGIAKRLTDIVLSLLSIIILSPLMLMVVVMIKFSSSGPVLYKGVRAGINGSVFKIWKFRTMVVNAEKLGGHSTAIDDPRFTPVGRILRKYKIDELPQFFNVLFGDMSFVGPRPQVLFYTDKYVGEEKLMLSVRPGITDLASLYFSDMDAVLGSGDVDARYMTEVEPIKNSLRLRYVKERSYWMDLMILIETAMRMIGLQNVTGLDVSPKKEMSND